MDKQESFSKDEVESIVEDAIHRFSLRKLRDSANATEGDGVYSNKDDEEVTGDLKLDVEVPTSNTCVVCLKNIGNGKKHYSEVQTHFDIFCSIRIHVYIYFIAIFRSTK